MEYFIKLNEAWREGINAEINDRDRNEHPEIATAFREGYGRYLLECKIAREPSKVDLAEIGKSYVDFKEGWDAAVDKLTKDQPGLVASWVRAHGELTDYSDLENNDYEAYIVKASDI